jgi:hypothetical protein
MRGSLAFACAVVLAACGPSTTSVPIKKPNNELLIGDFTRRGADGENAIRFNEDGTYRVVKNKSVFDQEPALGSGTWKIDGDQLTLTAQRGMCKDENPAPEATYKVVISKIGIRFEKVSDTCQQRATMDGQTWWRIQ